MDELKIIEHEGIRVLTTQQLAEVYETSTDNIKMNFKR
ncbi:ORF6N domain-containing protein, partial [Enterobacter asburiae]